MAHVGAREISGQEISGQGMSVLVIWVGGLFMPVAVTDMVTLLLTPVVIRPRPGGIFLGQQATPIPETRRRRRNFARRRRRRPVRRRCVSTWTSTTKMRTMRRI